MNNFDTIFKELGFDSTSHFVDSLVHPSNIKKTGIISGFLGVLGTYFETFFGIVPIVGFCICGLFFIELYTGIMASRLGNSPIKSKKLASGFIKLGIYFLFIGFANQLQVNMPVKEVFGYKLDYYSFIHYVFLNFTILQYMLSNLENFEKLGWEKNIPLAGKIRSILNFEKIKPVK